MNTEKIIQLLKDDDEIAQNLFLFSEFPSDVSLWTGPVEDNFDYSNIKWLFVTEQQNLTLVGISTIDNTVWCIDDEGDFHQDCDALQNLPYEILRLESFYTPNESIDEYFTKYKDYHFKETLARYEAWCNLNNIPLDEKRTYHLNDGSLFTNYFELDKNA